MSAQIGKQFGELFPSLAPGRFGLIACQEKAEIIAQAAVDRVLEVDLQDLLGCDSFRIAS
jgi:hypothetical protein